LRSIPGTITDPAADRILHPQPDSSGPATGAELLSLARALAKVVHAGQSRKGEGEPYFNHVDRVASRVEGWRAKAIAYLHDVIEDTYVDGTILTRIGFPRDLVLDVMALSREATETYTDFISRTLDTGSDDALRVKLADLRDNLADPWASETKLAERYIPAMRRVAAELHRREKR
jgi:(p)ppGpp synthase/HD superfamily hydrolase